MIFPNSHQKGEAPEHENHRGKQFEEDFFNDPKKAEWARSMLGEWKSILFFWVNKAGQLDAVGHAV